jgi:nucleotide-binding universal stress UspA family protein
MAIVVATDFSEAALEATDVAATLAALTGERLRVVDVVLPEALERHGYGLLRGRLDQEVGRLGQRGVEATSALLVGDDDGVLDEQLASATLAVMAAPSADASRAETLSQTARVPVLAVRPRSGLAAWAKDGRRLRILVAVDFSRPSVAAMGWVRHLRKTVPCDVIVAHVHWIPEDPSRYGTDGPLPLDRVRPEVEPLLLRDLRGWLGDLPGDGAVHWWVRPGLGRVDRHLTELAIEADADLVVVGTHQRAGLERLWKGSVSRGVVRGVPCSVVTVPFTEEALMEAPVKAPQRVLVATDCTPGGAAAVPLAFVHAAQGGEVRLVHVTARESDDADARRDLAALVPSYAADRGVVASIEILHGDPAEQILKAAERFGAELVVVATRARTGASRVLGSVAQAVVAGAHRPVLLVPPPHDE